jgi:hypothetical protein
MDAKLIEEAKESGQREVFRVRFPLIYGHKSTGFVCRTLLRGEVFRAFSKYGYPEREIPKDKAYDRCRIENELFPICVIDVPLGFEMYRAHSFVVTTVVDECLRRSGFIDGSDEQVACLKYGLRYANSIEGRTDAVIMKYFQQIRPYDLERMNYKEWSMRSMQAVLIAKSIDKTDLFEFMSPDPNVMSVFDPPSEEVQAVMPQAPATPHPASKPPPQASQNPPVDRSEGQRAELRRQLGLPPKITPQQIGLNQSNNPNIAIERGEQRTFFAGERYDVDELKPKIRQDAGD